MNHYYLKEKVERSCQGKSSRKLHLLAEENLVLKDRGLNVSMVGNNIHMHSCTETLWHLMLVKYSKFYL